jgi:hypothetical protein
VDHKADESQVFLLFFLFCMVSLTNI